MSTTLTLISKKETLKSLIFDILFIAAMYLVPAISHMWDIPLYLFEPLRIMIILAVVHTKRENAYFIALTLPLFSTLFSGHPFFAKMLVISGELYMNVLLYFLISGKMRNVFLSMLSAIVMSKVFYFLCEYIFLGEMIKLYGIGEHPLYLQAFVAVILSGYTYFILKRTGNKPA